MAVDSCGGHSATSATRGGRRCVEVSERSVPIEEVTTGLAEDDDLALIRRVAAQDRQAFEALYRRYAPLVLFATTHPVTASRVPAVRLVDACAALARVVVRRRVGV